MDGLKDPEDMDLAPTAPRGAVRSRGQRKISRFNARSRCNEDLLLYRAFLVDPQPANRWASAPGGRHPRGDSRWRPFNGPLSPASQRQALIILNGMFTWLVDAGYRRGNPMALLRQRGKHVAPRVTRYPSISLCDEVKGFVAQLPQATAVERAYYARCRWLTTVFYLQRMRLSEVAAGKMLDFSRRLGADGREQWWLRIVGKGEQERIVPASPELVAELARYRKASGLPPLPGRTDDTPLLIPFRGKRRCMSRSAVHDAINSMFGSAAAWIRARGPEFMDRADELDRASTHWLRRTSGSHQADGGADLRTVCDNLGHVSLNTTSRYLHAEEDKRHRETVKGHRVNWEAQLAAEPGAAKSDR